MSQGKQNLKKNGNGSNGKYTLKDIIGDIIFRHDTPESKAFDVVLLVMIVLSIIVVMLESVEALDRRFHTLFWALEWILTILFTIEYALRLYTADRRWAYVRSFYGIIDLVSIIPTYLTLFALSTQYLATVRILRLLRIFRIFKLTQFLGESRQLVSALKASRPKITVFLVTVLSCSVVIGAIMYMVESDEAGFTSIPRSIYWAIVTLTTVGYGDIAPQTTLGQFFAALVMIMGYGVIAVPTGIVTAEIANTARAEIEKQEIISCPFCDTDGLDEGDNYCRHCGSELD